MTDHDDRIAYEACGYTLTPATDGFGGTLATHEDGTRFWVGDPSQSWPSTDAAIAHAERGGFFVCDADDRFGTGLPDNRRWRVIVDRREDKSPTLTGVGPSLGLAIRNAIVAHAKGAE